MTNPLGLGWLLVQVAAPVTAASAQGRPIELTVDSGAGFLQLLVTLLVGLGGVAIGAMLTASYQHRQWLRDTRQRAYSELLLALDYATEAGDRYVRAARLYAERHLDDGADAMDQLVAMKMASDDWQPWRDARDALDRAATTFELVAPQTTERTATLARLGASIVSIVGYWHLESDDDARRAIESCNAWARQTDARRELRKQLVRQARQDLGVDSAPKRRLILRTRRAYESVRSKLTRRGRAQESR